MNRSQTIGNGKNKDLIKKLQATDKHQGSDLSGEMLFNIPLSKKDFSKSNFKNASLSGSDLSNCNLSSTDLTGTDLTATHLRFTDLTGAKRNGSQIIKRATVSIDDQHHYAFLCKSKAGKTVLINENNKQEYEFKRGNSTVIGAMLYNLLMMG